MAKKTKIRMKIYGIAVSERRKYNRRKGEERRKRVIISAQYRKAAWRRQKIERNAVAAYHGESAVSIGGETAWLSGQRENRLAGN